MIGAGAKTRRLPSIPGYVLLSPLVRGLVLDGNSDVELTLNLCESLVGPPNLGVVAACDMQLCFDVTISVVKWASDYFSVTS